MTLQEAIDEFERSLPNWWWKLISCAVSIEADCAPDVNTDISLAEASKVDERFVWGFTVELRHTEKRTYTPAEALMAVMKEAKKARAKLPASTFHAEWKERKDMTIKV
jgi:hypothetical protein